MREPSPRGSRRLLWLVSFLALPLPYASVERGIVPPIWLAVVGGLMLAAVLADGGAVTGLFMRLYLGQALVGVAGCWVAAYAVTAALERWTGPAIRRVGVITIVIGLLALAALPTYRSPVIRGGHPTNLLGLFVPA